MTICNMSIEAGARAGLIAPDDTTYEYMAGRPLAPSGAAWDAALAHWRTLPGDADAEFDKSVDIDVSRLTPMVTFGTNPGMVISIMRILYAFCGVRESLLRSRVFIKLSVDEERCLITRENSNCR